MLSLTVLSLAVSSEASVSIKGKPLDDIDDVVSLTTGSETAELKKYSLGVVSFRGTKSGKELYLKQFGEKASEFETYSDDISAAEGGSALSGMHIAVSSSSTQSGRAIFGTDYTADTANSKLTVRPYAAFVGSNGEVLDVKSLELTTSHNNVGDAYDQDVQGGIFLPNDSNEYFAVAMLKNSNLGGGSGTQCTANIFIVGVNFSGDKEVKIFDTGVVIEKTMQQEYSPVSVAVGDFTDSGKTDQIAFTTASAAGIELTVCKLEKDSGSNYSYRTLKTETVCTYTGRMKEGLITSRPDFYPSAETVAGDFDGDGKTEIAVVFKDDADDKTDGDKYIFGQLNVTIYKWDNNSGSFTSATQHVSLNDHDRHQTQYYDDEWWTNFLGLKAVRYDYDGEGKDGIAVLLLAHQKFHEKMDGRGEHYYELVCPYFMYWYCDQGTITPKYAALNREGTQYFDGDGIYTGSLGDHSTSMCMFGDKSQSKMGVFYYDQGVEGKALSGSYPYVDRSFTLASGPFLGQLGKFTTIDDLAVCWSIKQPEDPGRETDGRKRDNAYIFKTNHHTTEGLFIGVSPGANVYHYVQDTENDKSALFAADFFGEGVELAEPVHLKVEGDRTYAAVIQTPPYHVDNIPVPWSSEPTKRTLTNFTYSTELKSAYTHESSSESGQDVNFDMKGSAETVEAIGLDGKTTKLVKKVVSFALEKAGVPGAGAIFDSLVDKVDTTKSESNESSIKKSLTDNVETSTSDRVLYYSTNVHTWRYPIKEPAPSWLFTKVIEGGSFSISSDKFLTFSMADDPVFHTTAGLEDECYQPLHEEGNLFSYPSSLAYIPGYTNKMLELTGQSSITYSPGSHTQTVTVTQQAASKTTETRKVKYGIISNIAGTVQVLHGDATENSMSGERGNSSTFTKSYSTTDTLTASFPNPEGDYANVTFTTDLQAYADEAGILTLGFAVSKFGSTARLWQSSIYNEKPDPALYLPYKYYFSDNTVIARDDEAVATKMRGVRFYIPEAAAYTGSTLYAGKTYRIEIPIYNASFVAPDGTVDVALSFRDSGGSEKTLIARESVTIGGWESGTSSNKAVVSFDWTVPEDMAGAKELVAEIDPDDKIEEVHGGWNPDVPGGNNFGYFPFSVVKAESLPFRTPASHDIVLTIDGMSMLDFIGYAAGQTEAFDAECVITNNGASMVLALLELNLLASGNETVQSLTHNVGLMNSNESHSYKFMVNPENWKSCKDLEAVFYTDSGIFRKSTDNHSEGVSSSSSGCDAGLSVLGLGVILSALIIRRKAR